VKCVFSREISGSDASVPRPGSGVAESRIVVRACSVLLVVVVVLVVAV